MDVREIYHRMLRTIVLKGKQQASNNSQRECEACLNVNTPSKEFGASLCSRCAIIYDLIQHEDNNNTILDMPYKSALAIARASDMLVHSRNYICGRFSISTNRIILFQCRHCLRDDYIVAFVHSTGLCASCFGEVQLKSATTMARYLNAVEIKTGNSDVDTYLRIILLLVLY